MTESLKSITSKVYTPCKLVVSKFELEPESKAYEASKFQLNNTKVIYRHAKITPKKVGQFVTFWKRTENGTIAPLEETDEFDFFVISVRKGNLEGQFVFPKKVLLQKGLVSTSVKEGKRGFRVYPLWDTAISKQAKNTQKWQLNYFYQIDSKINLIKVSNLFS
ncbi:MepB family protein [Zobellia uliginosa]|uniref:MepB family protein n=1 Tax=Zobellia uliginosa TaxID=143224 RepID=UPI001C07B977|nr:MepB family protein [Zobellia uliginosa]MBU2946981.1 MepB family protein [Zobellia uliginosa]